eukprot:COSAG02_NODE_4124_length_5744_cov_7.379451_6_plen_243_part_00
MRHSAAQCSTTARREHTHTHHARAAPTPWAWSLGLLCQAGAGAEALLLSMPLPVRALGRQDSSAKHVALAQSELEADGEVRLDVADEPRRRRQAARAAEGVGVDVPGCCVVEVGGEELLLSCVDRKQLHVRTVPTSATSSPSATELDEARKTLHTISKVGHEITCFLKLPRQDVVVTGGEQGEVRPPTLLPPPRAGPHTPRAPRRRRAHVLLAACRLRCGWLHFTRARTGCRCWCGTSRPVP